MTIRTKVCPRFCYASLVLKELIFIIFSKKYVVLGQTYFFKNRELLIITKNRHPFGQKSFLKLKNSKFQGKLLSRSGTVLPLLSHTQKDS